MQFSNHSSRAQRGGIVYLAVDAIAPSAVQPRQNFPPAHVYQQILCFVDHHCNGRKYC